MLTPRLDENKKEPLYEQLYRYVRENIESGSLKEGEKLPSKRKLSAHLQISQSTVENAYAQLIAEGYIDPVEKKGYFVRGVEPMTTSSFTSPSYDETNAQSETLPYDLRTNTVDTEDFPYAIWSRLMRECMRQDPVCLLSPVHPQGDLALRQEIANYLHAFRGMQVSPGQIILGAGTEYLLGLITELLPQAAFAFEDPGYHKIAKLLHSRRMETHPISMDKEGMRVDTLAQTPASVALITPSHHFPLGTVMSYGRRQQLLGWAAQRAGRYLIEDDYDSEFRFVLKPIPALHSLNHGNNVIYMNTFAKTLAPSFRIAYMVLPDDLLARYKECLGFYSCTVSEFEQHTLKAFLQGGYYERHLNRMRTIYKSRRDAFIKGLSPIRDRLTIRGQSAGLHLLLRAEGWTEAQLIEAARTGGVGVYPLSGYYLHSVPETHTVVVGYAGLDVERLKKAAALLVDAWKYSQLS